LTAERGGDPLKRRPCKEKFMEDHRSTIFPWMQLANAKGGDASGKKKEGFFPTTGSTSGNSDILSSIFKHADERRDARRSIKDHAEEGKAAAKLLSRASIHSRERTRARISLPFKNCAAVAGRGVCWGRELKTRFTFRTEGLHERGGMVVAIEDSLLHD